ncbi:MAG: Type 1 glutamine amidotransferase-like domain-containing protein [Candidatus Saccharimonadales bacterium]
MRLYLSSYKFGNQPDKLFALLRGNTPKVAIVTNAADMHAEPEILERYNDDKKVFEQHGLQVERLDLRNFFDKPGELQETMKQFGMVWVRGGNVFLLRVAMKLSGFDEYVKAALANDGIVYAGYSAGGCVLSPSLDGFDIVDDPNVVQQVYGLPADYSGLGIIDYHFEPHYKSDHPESADVDKEIEYLKAHNIAYKTVRDGEAIVVDGNASELTG